MNHQSIPYIHHYLELKIILDSFIHLFLINKNDSLLAQFGLSTNVTDSDVPETNMQIFI